MQLTPKFQLSKMLTRIIVLLPILAQAKIESSSGLTREEQQYFKLLLTENKCRVVVLVQASEDYCEYFQEIKRILKKISLPYMIIDAKSVAKFNGPHDKKFSYKAIVDESRLYIVFISNIPDAKSVIPILKRIYFFRPRHRVALIVNKSSNETVNLEEISTVFKQFWTKEILNLVLIVRPYEAYIYRPYLGLFNILVTETGEELFPKRFIDLNQHVLRLSTFIAALDCCKTKTGILIGRDVELWRTIANYMNATVKHILPRDTITYGLKFSNGSMTGVFRDVVENITDLTANSRMVKLQFENLMEPTYPHDREDVTIIVPEGGDISEFVKFIKLFSLPLWILVGVGTVAFGMLWWWFYNRGQLISSLLDSYTLTLGNPVNEPPNTRARFLLLIYVSYIFFVQSAYRSLLSSVLTVPVGAPEINTLQELDESNIKTYAAVRFRDMFHANIGGSLTQKFVEKIITVPDDPDLEIEIRKHGYFAFVQKETFAAQSVNRRENFQSDGTPIYRMMKEKPMPTQVCYAARYGSPIIPKVNYFLRRFQEAGLDKHWKDITIHAIILDEKLGELPTPVPLKVLTFDNLSIAFVALALGHSLAFFVLLFERCTDPCRKI